MEEPNKIRRSRQPYQNFQRGNFKQQPPQPFHQRVKNFVKYPEQQFQKQKQIFVNSLERISDNLQNYIKPKHLISDNYKKFVQQFEKPINRQIFNILPVVLLSLTILAVKNKRLIKPFLEAYSLSSTLKPGTPVLDKIVFIIKEYANTYIKLDFLDSLELGMATLSLFIDDIPIIFKNLDRYNLNLSSITIQKNILKNVVELKKEYVDKPLKEREIKKQQQKEQQEQKQFRDDIQKLKEALSKNTTTTSKNTTTTSKKSKRN